MPMRGDQPEPMTVNGELLCFDEHHGFRLSANVEFMGDGQLASAHDFVNHSVTATVQHHGIPQRVLASEAPRNHMMGLEPERLEAAFAPPSGPLSCLSHNLTPASGPEGGE